ncbi:E3 ubiquitin-protein ligase RNF181-like [Benincasa hispida]|uniref:E3 ubiquitin-protein ligase RNF181-like n=1 Tax=Benincasa hispida TaxID=102211 RepID=UPI001901D707|nr:E3 ubiquitin-protein ligase RNF181-like [Benincasa hispida]
MSSAASTPIQYRLYGTGSGTGNGVLEVQTSYFERMISVSPVTGRPPRILHETPRIPFHNALFYLSLHQLQNPLFYISQFLSSLNICPAACEIMARQIASYIDRMINENRESNFRIIAEVDFSRVIWMEEHSIYGGDAMAEETVVFDEAPPPRRGVEKVAVERVRELKSQEELGDCCICLEELSCEKREVIRIPCGHVYHESCVFKWLRKNNSCPLCRKPLPLNDDSR